MSQLRGGNLAFAITNQCLSTLWGKSGETLVYYDTLIVRNGLIVTRALCSPPDICMVYYHTRDAQSNVQLKKGFLATKTILLCSQRKSIRLAENPDFEFWIRTSLPTKHGFYPWWEGFSNIPHRSFFPGHSMAGIPQWVDAGGAPVTNAGKEPKTHKWPDGKGGRGDGPEVTVPGGPPVHSLLQSNLQGPDCPSTILGLFVLSISGATSLLCFLTPFWWV